MTNEIGQKTLQKTFYDERFSDIKRGLIKLEGPTLMYDSNLMKKITTNACLSKNSIVLEVCAGQSTDALIISDRVGMLICTDISFNALQTGQRLSRILDKRNINFISCDAEHLPFRDQIFDFTFCKDALHHVSNPTKVVSEMGRCSKTMKDITVIEANAFNPQMILIGLIYYSIDKGVFKNTKSNLIKIFKESHLINIKIEYAEFLPRHILFYVKSSLNIFSRYQKFMSIINVINKIEKRIESLNYFKKFANYIIIYGIKKN